MAADLDAIVGRPQAGRLYARDQIVRLADAGVDGHVRLDALARWCQDVATDDRADAADDPRVVSDGAGAGFVGRGDPNDGSTWVLRRNRIEIDRLPRFVDRVRLVTWCSGIGARWAERRTDIVFGDDVIVRSAAVWVHVGGRTRRPSPLPPRFFEVWARSAGDRRVSARRTHVGPPAQAATCGWPLRATDADVLGHVNNSVYWSALLEVLGASTSTISAAEVEFRAGVVVDEELELRWTRAADALHVWCCVAGAVRASLVAHVR